MIWYLKYVREPSLGNDLDDVGDDCRNKDASKDEHCKIFLLHHKEWSSLEAMDGQGCNEHGCDSVSRNTQSHHRNQGSTERSVVCCLTGPDTCRVSFTEGFRFLADALGVSVGYHVGDT